MLETMFIGLLALTILFVIYSIIEFIYIVSKAYYRVAVKFIFLMTIAYVLGTIIQFIL